jgi:hypothetical protein
MSTLSKYRRSYFFWPLAGELLVLVLVVVLYELGFGVQSWEAILFLGWPAFFLYRVLSFRCPNCRNRLWHRKTPKEIFGFKIQGGAYLFSGHICEWCGFDLKN